MRITCLRHLLPSSRGQDVIAINFVFLLVLLVWYLVTWYHIWYSVIREWYTLLYSKSGSVLSLFTHRKIVYLITIVSRLLLYKDRIFWRTYDWGWLMQSICRGVADEISVWQHNAITRVRRVAEHPTKKVADAISHQPVFLRNYLGWKLKFVLK